MSLLCVGKVKVERAHTKTWHTMIATESPDLDLLSNSLSKNLEHINVSEKVNFLLEIRQMLRNSWHCLKNHYSWATRFKISYEALVICPSFRFPTLGIESLLKDHRHGPSSKSSWPSTEHSMPWPRTKQIDVKFRPTPPNTCARQVCSL